MAVAYLNRLLPWRSSLPAHTQLGRSNTQPHTHHKVAQIGNISQQPGSSSTQKKVNFYHCSFLLFPGQHSLIKNSLVSRDVMQVRIISMLQKWLQDSDLAKSILRVHRGKIKIWIRIFPITHSHLQEISFLDQQNPTIWSSRCQVYTLLCKAGFQSRNNFLLWEKAACFIRKQAVANDWNTPGLASRITAINLIFSLSQLHNVCLPSRRFSKHQGNTKTWH